MNWTRHNLLKLGTLAGLGLAIGQTLHPATHRRLMRRCSLIQDSEH
jgi:hypothetical protein